MGNIYILDRYKVDLLKISKKYKYCQFYIQKVFLRAYPSIALLIEFNMIGNECIKESL